MTVVQVLFSTMLAPGLEQLIQTRYGVLATLGFSFTAAGIKARNATCASIGAVLLALLVIQA
ncbi:hypothetical protein [Streptomyces sp. NPDC003635]